MASRPEKASSDEIRRMSGRGGDATDAARRLVEDLLPAAKPLVSPRDFGRLLHRRSAAWVAIGEVRHDGWAAVVDIARTLWEES